MIRPRHIRPADWERMSWTQRTKASTQYLKALEAERPARRLPDPTIVGPFSDLTRAAGHPVIEKVRKTRPGAVRLMAALINDELERIYRESLPARAEAARVKFGPYAKRAACGTESGARRHRKYGEVCGPCREAERAAVRARKAQLRPKTQQEEPAA